VRDIFDTDLSRATVVAFYLLPEFNAKLLPRLLALKPGTRIVSHDGGIGDWPERRAPRAARAGEAGGRGRPLERRALGGAGRRARRAGRARFRSTAGAGRSTSRQRYQALEVDVGAQGRDLLVRNSRLRGTELKLVVTGIVDGRPGTICSSGSCRRRAHRGTLTVSDGNQTRSYSMDGAQAAVASRGAEAAAVGHSTACCW
jgi:hypothetical protein